MGAVNLGPAVDAALPVGIAVDGGGSKTDVIAVDAAGHVLAEVHGGPSSPQVMGADVSARTIADLVARASAAVRGVVRHIGIYLSGLDLPAEHDAFASAFAPIRVSSYPDATVTIDNDLFALLRAGTREADAVAIVCGTGINCVGVRADGQRVRYPALGAISGDWGGGWHLGEKALWHAARAADGRGPHTELAGRIPGHFGFGALDEVIEALHFGRVASERLAELSPVVFAAADGGDAVAVSLVDRQAEEIVAFAVSALSRLGLAGAEVPVVLGGGLIRSGHTRLLGAIERGLAEQAAGARMVAVDSAPVFGAGLLVAEALGGAVARLAPSPRSA